MVREELAQHMWTAAHLVPDAGRGDRGDRRPEQPSAPVERGTEGTGRAQDRERRPIAAMGALDLDPGRNTDLGEARDEPLGRLTLALGGGRPRDVREVRDEPAERRLLDRAGLDGIADGHGERRSIEERVCWQRAVSLLPGVK